MNTLKNYTSKPKSAYNNMPLYQISVNLENIRFWDQICPKKYDKNFERINIKIVISIQQFTLVRNFSHLVELQIIGPNLPENIGVTKILEFQVVPCFSKYGDPVSCDLFHTSWFVFFYLSFLNT